MAGKFTAIRQILATGLDILRQNWRERGSLDLRIAAHLAWSLSIE
jgi:hypothetical protein